MLLDAAQPELARVCSDKLTDRRTDKVGLYNIRIVSGPHRHTIAEDSALVLNLAAADRLHRCTAS